MSFPKWIKWPVDLVVTFILWTYFTLGYCLFFSPFYFFSYWFSKNPEISFQKLNHRFLKIFFKILQFITPGLKIHIEDQVYTIRSSIVLCNHISFLDPILLVSIFEKQKTIIKKNFLEVPIFGWFMKKSGYLFPETEEIFTSFLLEGVNSPENYLQSGGNIFVFPEGTRSLDGKLGRLKKGAFSLARQCRAPIEVLTVKNTNQLFRPGKWLFNTCLSYKIEVKKIKSLQPDYNSETFSLQALIEEVRQVLEKELES